MKHRFARFLKPIATTVMRSWVVRFPLARGLYHSCLRPFLPSLALFSPEAEGLKMQLRVSKYDAAFSGLLFGVLYEEQVTRKLKDIVREGMTVVDVGANFGYHTVFIARLVGEKGKVFAFEPNPFAYNLLQENIKLNQLNNVIPVQKAVSNAVGTTKLWLASNIGASNILSRRDRKNSTDVESTSLDEFFRGDSLPSIDVLKMDIEGAELLALQGMNRIMAKNGNLKMIIEFHPHHILAFGHSPEELWVGLRQNGFWPPFLLSKDGQLIELRTPPDIENVEKERHPIHLFIERKT